MSDKNKETQEKLENKITIKNEFVPLFNGVQNPNHDIFVVPTQAGSDEEDQWNGSIGDATMEHVTNMSHRLMEMEHYVHMSNGNIFRVENNVAPPDEEGSRSIKNDITILANSKDIRAFDLSKIQAHEGYRQWPGSYAEYQTGVTAPLRTSTLEDKKNVLEFLKQEIENAKLAKEERNDVMEQTRIPFSEWEFNPQMANTIDMPSTPTPLYIYAGNSKDIFYDEMPEDHPDKSFIVKLLNTANSIEWDNFTEETVDYFKKKIEDYQWKHLYASQRLIDLFLDISTGTVSPTQLAQKALSDIDSDWGSFLKETAILKFNLDPIVSEMKEFESSTLINYSLGRVVWGDIGKFGQYLFKKYGNQMTTAHWNYYKNMKTRFSPTVFVGSLNINTANMNELRSLFANRFKEELETLSNLTDNRSSRRIAEINRTIENLAASIFFKRPFFSVEDLAAKNIITVADLGYTNNTVVIISSIKKAYSESLRTKSMSSLSRIAQQIINLQQNNPKRLMEQEWLNIWQVYRVCKGNLMSSLGINTNS